MILILILTFPSNFKRRSSFVEMGDQVFVEMGDQVFVEMGDQV